MSSNELIKKLKAIKKSSNLTKKLATELMEELKTFYPAPEEEMKEVTREVASKIINETKEEAISL